MCRFTLYLGPPIRLDTLLIEPSHSLIRQSFHSRERAEPLNGDGFGVGWYAPALSDEPALFREVTPAWNDQNLRSLARVVSSPCILAHVRAATDGMAVSTSNCHPFQFGRWLFMHNGAVGGFANVRRPLLEALSDEAFGLIQGSTDSEHLFALFVDEVRRKEDGRSAESLANCLNRVVYRLLDLVDAFGDGASCSLNIALADGDRAVACRFSDDPVRAPESLYYITHQLYPPTAEESPRRRPAERSQPLVVSSERLTEDPGWAAVPNAHVIAVERDREPRLYAMTPEGLVSPPRRAPA